MRADDVPFVERQFSPAIGAVVFYFFFVVAWLCLGFSGLDDYRSFHSAFAAKAALIPQPGYFWLLKWFAFLSCMHLGIFWAVIRHFRGAEPLSGPKWKRRVLWGIALVVVGYVITDLLNTASSDRINDQMAGAGYSQCFAGIGNHTRDFFVSGDMIQKHGCPVGMFPKPQVYHNF